jgi:hypothetical protein
MGVGQEAQDTAMFRELEERLLQPDGPIVCRGNCQAAGRRVHRVWKLGPRIQ